jgi:hypothetical protein
MLGTMGSASVGNATSMQHIPKWQRQAYKDLMGQASSMYGAQTNAINQQVPGIQDYVKRISDITAPAWQDQLQGGIYKDVNPTDLLNQISAFQNTQSSTQPLYESIMGGKGNNYVDAMKDTFMKDAQRRRDLNYASLDARQAASGMSGGARHGVAQALIDRDINDNLGKQMTQVGYESFDKDLQNKLGIAKQADANTLSRQTMFSDMANNLIAGKNTSVENGLAGASGMQGLGMGQFSPTMMPWSNLQNYQSAIGNPMVLTNSRQSSMGSSGKGV